MKIRITVAVALGATFLAALAPRLAIAGGPDDAEFFEKRVRPLLQSKCVECHGADEQNANLRLDSKAGLMKGGDRGAPVVAGEPAKSLIIQAVQYDDVDLQMPPDGKLSDADLAVLNDWVQRGAHWPGDVDGGPPPVAGAFDLEARKRSHWAWQPLRPASPPAVADAHWPWTDVDRFLLARLEREGIAPAPDVDPRARLRRLALDLTGLPPSDADLDAVAKDPSPATFERVVDRLLASPAFGERWGRHWLDLARFAETLGHEEDYPIYNSWRYRDYVIRAFNADVPFSQLLTEHLAGDLLDRPRRNPSDGSNESIQATAFYWFPDQRHSPVDTRQHMADVRDNQIDVICKTFLGLTVSCARCHDHKFDAISTKDYYALSAMLASSRYRQAPIDDPDRFADPIRRLAEHKRELRRYLGDAWMRQAEPIAALLMTAQEIVDAGAEGESALRDRAERFKLSADRLRDWTKALRDPGAQPQSHPLRAWMEASAKEPAPLENIRDVVIADFAASDPHWFADGHAFNLAKTGDFTFVAKGDRPGVRVLDAGWAHSGSLASPLQGTLRSPTFVIDKRFVHLLVMGAETRVNLSIDGFTLIRAPIYGGLKIHVTNPNPHWITFDVGMWKGRAAYLELVDQTVGDLGYMSRQSYPADAFVAVQRVVISDAGEHPPMPSATPAAPEPASDRPALAKAYAQLIAEAARAFRDDELATSKQGPAYAALLDGLLERRLLATPADFSQSYLTVVATIPESNYVPAMADGNGRDAAVFVRGNPRASGEIVPRRFLEAFVGAHPSPIAVGSGRLDLARQMLESSRHLVARVYVNRVWSHLFGRGIVPTVDNFGAHGEAPTHPELLDFLAQRFIDEGWSTKRLIRELALTRAYQISSRAAPEAIAKDPKNLLWGWMPMRRLEGESIRDVMLTLSGRMDRTMGGPSVPVHLTPFMDGRGRPGSSGPRDGAGRRSVYLEVRRNFLSPFFLAFDAPTPFATVGRRGVSNVPAQALILLNDPFVHEQAELWAKRVLAGEPTAPDARAAKLFEQASARPALPAEVADAVAFVNGRREAYASAGKGADADRLAWTDLCHVLFNLKEFIYY